MNGVDLTPLVQPLVQVLALVLLGLAAPLAAWLVYQFQKRTGIQLTDQQRAIVAGVVQTGVGIINADLARGAKQLNDVHIDNDQIRNLAKEAMVAAPMATSALGVTEESMAKMIVAGVGKSIATDPSIPSVAPVHA